MTSLVSWLKNMGLVITVQGDEADSWESEIIEDNLEGRISRHERGVVLKGEDSLEEQLLPVEMRVGQCWEIDSKVLEITGFTSDGAEYLEWTPTQNTIAAESILNVDTTDNYAKYPTGLGTSLSISLAALNKLQETN